MSQKKLQVIYESIISQLVGPKTTSMRLGMATRKAIKDITGFDPADPTGQGGISAKKSVSKTPSASPSIKNAATYVTTKPLKSPKIKPKENIHKYILQDLGVPEKVLSDLKHGKIKRLTILDDKDESIAVTFKNGEYYISTASFGRGLKTPSKRETLAKLRVK